MHRKSWALAAFGTCLFLIQLALAGADPLWAQYVHGPKLTIINNSGYSDSEVYLVFIARPYSETSPDKTHRLLWPNGEFLPTFPVMDPDFDNTVTVPGANSNPYADYSTTLDKLSRDPATGHHFFNLPQKVDENVLNNKAGFDSGRLWISFKKPCYFHVYIKDNKLTYTQPTFSNPTDANYTTIFDFFEPQLAVSPDGINTIHADTTNVDSVAMPLLYELKNGATSIGKKGLARSMTIMRGAFLTDPTFKALVTQTCIMAPGHGIELGKLSSTYYKNYVDHCWKYWQDNLLSFNYFNTQWSGKVNSSQQLILTGKYNNVDETHYINYPSSKDIFFCNNVFDGVNHNPPIDEYVVRDAGLKNQIASALTRTVMHLAPYPSLNQITEFPWQAYAPPTGSGGHLFYHQNGLTADNYKTNVYSKLLHEMAIDGTIYGFAYDDNARQASYIDGVATDVILTIGRCAGNTESVLDLLLD